jgi:transposase
MGFEPERARKGFIMAQIFHLVGIDVGKKFLDCKRRPDNARLRVANDAEGWAKLAAWIADAVGAGGRADSVRVGFEASGGYERGAVEYLMALGHDVRLLHAQRVKKFREATGGRAKNDAIDADAVLDFTAHCELTAKLPDRARDALTQWLNLREALVGQRTRLKNLREHQAGGRIARITEAQMAQVARAIADVDRDIAAAIGANPDFAALRRQLTSVPGVGPVLAATLIARVPELGRIDRHHIAALVGVAPFDDDSAERRGKRSIGGGRAEVRRALYMAALAATRYNTAIKAFYLRLRKSGKAAKVALVACMRKLIAILNAMVAQGTAWREPQPQA